MLTYDLERRGTLARYDYLYRCIKEDILSGRLSAGEKLPSKRALASHLRTAVTTVENAYAQLAAEGYVVPRERSGYYVGAVEMLPPAAPRMADCAREESAREWLLDLRGGGVGAEGFPFSVWARLMRRELTERGEMLLRATPPNGAPELREAIARHLRRFRGIEVSPEQLVVGAGTEYLCNLLVQLLGREAVYGVEEPGHSKAARIYALAGVETAALTVDGEGVVPEAVARAGVQVLHTSPNHQFPTGVTMPIARRQTLLRWAEAGEGRWIIEDDYDSEFRFALRPIPTLKSIDRAGRVLYVNTFSRTLAPSLRISYLALPEGLVARYRERLGFCACTVPAMEQYTLARFLDEGYFEAHVSRMRNFYRARREQVLTAIARSPLAPHSYVSGEDAGLHFLLTLDTDKSDRALAREAAERGLRLVFLSDFAQRPDAARAHVLVVNDPAIALDRLDEALRVLSELL